MIITTLMDTYQFCPRCGTKAERKLHNLLTCPNCGYYFYINPASTNAAILENPKGEILFVRRKFDPFKGFLDLPGGFVETGESLEESTIREIKEELGIDVPKVTYFGSYPDEYMFQGVNIKTLGFVLTAKIDIEDVDGLELLDDAEEPCFYSKDKLPVEKIAFGSLRQALRDYIKQKFDISPSPKDR